MDETLSGLQRLTGIPIATFRGAIDRGDIPGRQSGSVWLINTSEPRYQAFVLLYKPRLKRRLKAKNVTKIQE